MSGDPAYDRYLGCDRCEFYAPLRVWPENRTGIHNAIRCLACGSTRNAFNRAHSTLMSSVIEGSSKGPVTTEHVWELVDFREKYEPKHQ